MLEDNSKTFYFKVERKHRDRLIKALLALKNVSQQDIAKKYGISASDLNKVIQFKRRTNKIRKVIAFELGVDERILFGNDAFTVNDEKILQDVSLGRMIKLSNK